MGKGLSKLQEGLLLMALGNVDNAVSDEARKEIFKKLHDRRDSDFELPHLTTHEALQGCTHRGARVSISRAFKRLEERGLAKRFYQFQVSGHLLWSGINLTEEGRRVAKNLISVG